MAEQDAMPVIEELPSSSLASVYSDPVIIHQSSNIRDCCAYIWSLVSSPFNKTEMSTLSLVHLICTLGIGISLSISVKVEDAKHVTKSSFYYFLVFYMLASILWLLGTICFGSKAGCCLARAQHDGHISGYLIIGVTFLCIGSSFNSAVECLPFLFSRGCSNITDNKHINEEMASEALFSVTKFVFLILQLYFFCRFSSKTFLDSSIIRVCLMHVIAVNLCTWFYIIVDESVQHSLPKYNSCAPLESLDIFKEAVEGFLYPFSIEYSVMSSVLLFLLWYRLKSISDENEPQSPDNPAGNQGTPEITIFQKIRHFLFEKCCREGFPQGVKKPASFWKSAICGYVLGVGMLVYILVIVAVVVNEFENSQPNAVRSYYGSRIAINFILSVTCLFGIKYLNNHQVSKQNVHTIVDTALIMIGISGCYLFIGFQVTSEFNDYNTCINHTTRFPATNLTCNFLNLNIADSLSSLVEFTLQGFFIVRALKRCSLFVGLLPRKYEISSALVVRRCSAFLSITNIGMWVMDTFDMKSLARIEVIESRAFNSSTWLILSHVASPLCIFFRLHSCFCCFEIVINRFEIRVLSENEDSSYHAVSSDEETQGMLENPVQNASASV